MRSKDVLSDCEPSRGDRFICVHASADYPSTIKRYSSDSGVSSTLYDPNPWLSEYDFNRVDRLNWEDEFGNETYGDLVHPLGYRSGESYPLVIVTYQSRGFLRGGVGDEYPIYPMANAGFFVLSHEMPLNARIVSEEPDVTRALYEDLQYDRAPLSAQKLIIEQLVDEGKVDPERIAITGLSRGASQVSYGLTNSGLFATGIVSQLASYSNDMYHESAEFMRVVMSDWLGGHPNDPDTYWDELWFAGNMSAIDAPLLINSSEQELLYAAGDVIRLKEGGIPVEMYVFPDGNHIKWRPDQRLAIYRRNIQWLKFWLQNEESENPISPGQYDRWRQLRHDHCARLNLATKPIPTYCR